MSLFVEDLPDDFDYQRILDENEEMRGCLNRVIMFGSQRDENGQWVTIKQLTHDDMEEIKLCLDKVNSDSPLGWNPTHCQEYTSPKPDKGI